EHPLDAGAPLHLGMEVVLATLGGFVTHRQSVLSAAPDIRGVTVAHAVGGDALGAHAVGMVTPFIRCAVR
ncbi:MAG: hypothetical protein ACO3ER_02915, partial [Ilumatobacteraceae bacterium]